MTLTQYYTEDLKQSEMIHPPPEALRWPDLENQLEQFRKTFRYKNVFVEDEYMVYRCPRGYSDKMVADAQDLIKRLNLNLVATGSTFLAKDSFTIREKK